MSIEDRQSYDAWKAGRQRIPDFNWTEHVAEVGTGPRNRKKFEQRVRAMDVIWGGREQDEEGKRGITVTRVTVVTSPEPEPEQEPLRRMRCG